MASDLNMVCLTLVLKSKFGLDLETQGTSFFYHYMAKMGYIYLLVKGCAVETEDWSGLVGVTLATDEGRQTWRCLSKTMPPTPPQALKKKVQVEH